MELVCRMVAQGAGVAIVSESAARRSTVAAGLAVLRLREPWARRGLWLVARDFPSLPRPTRQLAEWLRPDPPRAG